MPFRKDLNMSTVEIETGRYVKRFEFWNPATWSIPKLYWDAWSQEQRLHAICRQLEKVIGYADYLGVNVDDIAARLKAIEEGQLDEWIIENIEEWFAENEPEILESLRSLQSSLPSSAFDSENTVKDSIDDLDSRTTDNEEAISGNTGNIATLQGKPNKNNLNIVCIGDSYGRGVGGSLGWPDYLQSYMGCNYMLNISNSGAGFVAEGHSTPYEGMTYSQQVTYAANHLTDGMTVDDIDLVIIAGGYNDHAQSDVFTAARSTVQNAYSKFPNAKVLFFPLVAGDRSMDASYWSHYQNMTWGCGSRGAATFPGALFWLYPWTITTSYGDNIHPNDDGYRYIGQLMASCVQSGNMPAICTTWGASAENFSFAEDATNENFRCGSTDAFGWFGGCIKRTGWGNLCTLPSYLRPPNTTYILAFFYQDSTHHGIVRLRNTSNGVIEVFQVEAGTYDNTVEASFYIPRQTIPLGRILS